MSEIEIRVVSKQADLSALDQTEKKVKQLGGSMRRVGEIAAGMLAADTLQVGARKAVALLQSTVKAASDLGESVNAVQKTFGSASGQIEEFGKTAATEVGLSARAFNQMATPLGAILKNQGLGLQQVADETINLTKRASDMASVFNTDVGEALFALQAGLRGESEPLRRFGISLSEVAIQQKALATTGKSTAAELTAQEKAVARLAIIYEQSAQTAGDFKDTSDGLANSQRISAAQIENAKAQIGTAFLPVMAKAAQVTGLLANQFSQLSSPIKTTIALIVALGAGAVIVVPRILAMKAALDAAAASGSRAAAGIGLATTAIARFAPWLIALDIQRRGEVSLHKVGDAAEETAGQQEVLTDAIKEQEKEADKLISQWEKLHGVQVAADKEMLEAKEAIDAVGEAFDENGKKIRGNSQAALKNRIAMADAAKEAVEAADAYREQTGDAEGAAKMLEQMRRAMVKATGATGAERKEVERLSKELYSLPKVTNLRVIVHTEGELEHRRGERSSSGRAHGGITGAETGGARGSWTWVGERGPELVKLPFGSMVYPHGQSMNMAEKSGGSDVRVVVEDRTSSGIRARLIQDGRDRGISEATLRAAYP